MSYAPFPSNDGSDQQQDPARVAGLRLRDAQQIAANRLDSGGDGSLKDALADVIANGAPRDDIERLTDRIGAAQAAYITLNDAPALPFLAEGPNFGFGAEKKEQTLADLPQWSEARATVAAELADMQSQPLFLQTDQQQLGGGTHWQPTEQDAEPYHPVLQEPAPTFVAEAAPVFEPPLPAASLPEPPLPAAPLPEPPVAPSDPAIAPINTALDAAAKLAADADAAAAALESLTRMLQAHRRPASMIPAPQDVPQRPVEPVPRPAAPEPHAEQMAPRPAAAEVHPAQVNYAQAAPRPDAPEHDPLQMAPRQPRPVQRPVQLVPKPTSFPEPLRPVRPPMLRPTPMARNSRQFDLRGFLAGFAFAWAIGAMIYIYLLAG